MASFRITIVVFLLLVVLGNAHAQANDLKPGDVIGPHNWQRVQGMVGENLLNRIKGGYTFKIKAPTPRRDPKEYIEATEKYAGKVSLGSSGELINYVAGRPFPYVSPSDPQAGLKLAWNWEKAWEGDDFKIGGDTTSGKAAAFTIEKDGAERRIGIVVHVLHLSGRVTLAPKPSFPGYEGVDTMTLRATEYPRDTSGNTILGIRYNDINRDPDNFVFVPSIRRVRRLPPGQSCVTAAPSEFIFDNIPSFRSKVIDYDYKFLGKQQMLSNSSLGTTFARKHGDYLPLDAAWDVVDTYVLEITPKNTKGCYPRRVVYVDTSTFRPVWQLISDSNGRPWKENWSYPRPHRLNDGQEVTAYNIATIVNLKNGRSSLIESAGTFNNDYQPSLFTLQTLQTVMRGGALR